MSIVTIQLDREKRVWEAADMSEGARANLQVAHIERVDASSVRVTCSDGFVLASVVYAATVPDDFNSAVDIPAIFLERVSIITSGRSRYEDRCDECGQDRPGERNRAPVMLDTVQRVAECADGNMTIRVGFTALSERRGFPDWRRLVAKVIDPLQQDRATPYIAFDPTLLAQASRAIGRPEIARICLPATPSASALILGEGGKDFALAMPMYTDHEEVPAMVHMIKSIVEGTA